MKASLWYGLIGCGLVLLSLWSPAGQAVSRVVAGPERRSKIMTEEDKKITAYHEGGHALVAAALPGNDPVHKITILPRGRALGYTLVLPDAEEEGIHGVGRPAPLLPGTHLPGHLERAARPDGR